MIPTQYLSFTFTLIKISKNGLDTVVVGTFCACSSIQDIKQWISGWINIKIETVDCTACFDNDIFIRIKIIILQRQEDRVG